MATQNPVQVIVEESARCGLTLTQVLGHSTLTEFVKCRRAIARRLREDGFSYAAIGRAMGGRGHQTIMNLLGVTKRSGKNGSNRQMSLFGSAEAGAT
jgi:hypothetical protein